jgi:diguanylate cyclase (GGDEF)-like protein
MKEKRIRILCVEDDTVDQMAVKRLVKTGGLPYDIVVAGTLSEASGLLEKNSYDLVLLDYTLPDGTGLELLKKIKETPSIFITGSGNEGVAVRAIKGGAYDYLIKNPEKGHLELLSTTIEKVMHTFRLEQEHRQAEEQIIRQNAELESVNSKLSALYEKTKFLSLHDSLTGLANRRLLHFELRKNIAIVKRYGRFLSASMLDIDHFKKYNDTYGHLEGDKLLVDIAKIISKETRETDLAVRYGGEEFFILLPETQLKDACKVAERLRKGVEERAWVTVSLGVSVYNHEMQGDEELIYKADEAMYRAKRNGRNCVEVSFPGPVKSEL